MKKSITTTLLLLLSVVINAQMMNPVKFTSTLKTNSTAEAEIVFNGTIESGWHVYSTNLGKNGPIEASLNVNKLDGVELVGKLTPKGKEISKYDPMFEMNLRYFEHSVQFVQKVKFTKPIYKINVYLEYGACNDQNCMPPSDVTLIKNGKSPAVDAKDAAKTDEKANETEANAVSNGDSLKAGIDSANTVSSDTTSAVSQKNLWQPVVKELQQYSNDGSNGHRSLLYIFLMGLLGGLLAILMPCIWPIIPMTVSFFLKRSNNRRQSIRDAITYGISIIVIYVGLGLAITLIFGGNKLNELSTNAVFNIFLFLLLVAFAVSFFGWFEIKLPDKWGNAVDSKASRTSGLISIFLMAFTLTLVSFSCTAPIIGLLLAEMSTTGNVLGPTVGMLGFALALALPFSLFAMFPTWMKQMPKSGSWMETIKVVLGFIELAFALKFFSVADMAYGWHLMDREVFLSLWIVIFGAMGLYLIGMLKFPVDAIGGDLNKPRPVPSIMLGLCSIAFAIYMLPGLWGAPCKAVSAFAPPLNTQDFNLNTKEVRAKYNDYDIGMAAAASEGKPVLIDFTGFGCVNCRKMEAKVWTDPRVSNKLENDYVLISLFVDDKTRLPEPIDVTENGQKRTLRTIGDKWSYLQRSKFGANAQPFYVALDNDGKPLTGAYSFNEDISKYIDFLDKGLKNYVRK
jgi:thiol:disulfide interchange protein